MSTNVVSAKSIQRKWHLINAKNQILGRLSTEIATILMGKNKPEYVPYLDMGDNVVVINASSVKTTGKKESQKRYVRHSGYPGGLKVESLAKVREIKPEKVIISAVSGMIPKSKLGKKIVRKLHVFAGAQHTFEAQLKIQNSRSKDDEPVAQKVKNEEVGGEKDGK